jgi:2-dehydro-3-deoxyphosphooctonate aldolase (KDO 8-P synthase)
VVDYTGILDMMQFGYPVMMDATHSAQKPGGANGKSGGNRAYAPMLAQAAAAIGVKGFFIETHPRPDSALSDGPNMIYLNEMYSLLQKLLRISEAIT